MSEHKLKKLATLTRAAYEGEEKARVEKECRASMDALVRAFMGQIKTPDLVPDAMEFLSMMHFTILLHRFEPRYWERLLVTYNERMYERFEEVDSFVEQERKNERETEPSLPPKQ